MKNNETWYHWRKTKKFIDTLHCYNYNFKKENKLKKNKNKKKHSKTENYKTLSNWK